MKRNSGKPDALSITSNPLADRMFRISDEVCHKIDTLPRRRPISHPDSDTPNTINVAYGTLQSGIYAIRSAAYDHRIKLSTGGKDTTLHATQRDNDPSVKWKVTKRNNGTYSIVNEAYELSAAPNAPVVTLKDTDIGTLVVGRETASTWYICEAACTGDYMIIYPPSSSLYWALADRTVSTSVSLSNLTSELDVPENLLWNFEPFGADTIPLFHFTFRLNCSQDTEFQTTSFIEQPLKVNLWEDFTLLTWVFCENQAQCRSIVSFESPQCATPLLTLSLPPASQKNLLHFAYMTGTQDDDLVDLHGKAQLPSPGAWFHVALVSKMGDDTGDTFTTYVNGGEDVHVTAEKRIFHAEDISVTIGPRKCVKKGTVDWNGSIEGVYIYQAALTQKQVNDHWAEGSLRTSCQIDVEISTNTSDKD